MQTPSSWDACCASGRLTISSLRPGLGRFTAVVHRGHLYRLAGSAAGRPSTPFGKLEAFWAYLQRQLRAKGGIRRERLGLYLAEYAWRYNHRYLSPSEQLQELLTLVGRYHDKGTQ
jgi:hypothetical protein